MQEKQLKKKFNELLKNNDSFTKWFDGLKRANEKGFKSVYLYQRKTGTQINWSHMLLMSRIFKCSSGEYNEEEFTRNLESLKEEDWIKSYKHEKMGSTIVTKDKIELRILRITDYVPGIEHILPDLLTDKKRGHCHFGSLCLSTSIDCDNNIVSGLVGHFCPNKKYLHSWIEFRENDKDWVMDYTYNMIFDKEGYYRIFHPTDIVKISVEKHHENIEVFRQARENSIDFDSRMYLFYPEETIEILNKKYQNEKICEKLN